MGLVTTINSAKEHYQKHKQTINYVILTLVTLAYSTYFGYCLYVDLESNIALLVLTLAILVLVAYEQMICPSLSHILHKYHSAWEPPLSTMPWRRYVLMCNESTRKVSSHV